MLTRTLDRAVSLSARQPWLIAVVALGLTIAAAFYAIANFDMTTDTAELISPEAAWRQDEERVARAFPGGGGDVLVVIDGKTPELAEDAAARLAHALAEDEEHFITVRRAGGEEFFKRNGLLFASVEEVRETTEKLIEAQPLLGGLAADPSLRGIADTIATAAGGVADDPADPAANELEVPLERLHTAVSDGLAGKAHWLSWQQMLSATDGDLAPPLRQLILVRAKLDFGSLQPGAAAVGAIRAKADELNIDAERGLRFGITGEVPLSDEEFGTIEDSMGPIGLLMAAAMLITLWFATRSAKTVAAIMLTIICGLIISTALGLATAGRLNLISLAFIPLFVGLGVDFGIQVSVRFNAERREGAGLAEALERAGRAVGAPVMLAAAAIVLALAAFLPTDYIGVAELGLISGLGMIVAFVLNVTLLPALLMLLCPAPPKREVGFTAAAPVDRWLERNRKPVLWSFVAAMVGSIALLPLVEFDFNPLHLRNPDTPAMSQLRELMDDPQRSPNTINVLRSDEESANRLAERLRRLPEVRDALTLDSLVPGDQEEKLFLLQDAAFLLDPAINPFELPPAPDDGETNAALTRAEVELRRLAEVRPDELGAAAANLAESFTRLAAAEPEVRSRIEAMLVPPLEVTLDQIRYSLQPSEVTRETIPPELRRDFIGEEGQALVTVLPAGDSTDNEVLTRFSAAVQRVAPDAVGLPIGTQAAARTISWAFVQAGILSLILVSLLLFAVLRSVREVAFTLAPVVLSGFLTLGSCVVIGQPLNFANIIAFPLLFGVGVAFHIYFVMAWRAGTGDLLQTSLARAVLFSALATGSAFGALWLSDHPGTASMGLILMISLIWTLVCALIFEPALLGPPQDKHLDGYT
jgi:uncharacterized protein